MSTQNFLTFAFTSFLLNITPGNDMIYVISRTLSQGMKAGIISSISILAGCLFHTSLLVIGISQLIKADVGLYTALKYLGAAYIIWLGYKLIFNYSARAVSLKKSNSSLLNVFREGLVVNILNPKVTIFFISFLPQFVAPETINIKWQLFFLGSWFAVQGTIVLITVVMLAYKISRSFAQGDNIWVYLARFSGSVLILLGTKIFLTK